MKTLFFLLTFAFLSTSSAAFLEADCKEPKVPQSSQRKIISVSADFTPHDTTVVSLKVEGSNVDFRIISNSAVAMQLVSLIHADRDFDKLQIFFGKPQVRDLECETTNFDVSIKKL